MNASLAFALVGITACSSKSADESPPAKQEIVEPSAHPSAGSSAPAVAIDDLLDAAIRWHVQMATIEIAFDGSCATHATRLVAMSPLADALRDGLAALSPADRASFDQRLHAAEPQVMTKVDEALKLDGGKTRAELGLSEKAIQKCFSNPEFRAVMTRGKIVLASPAWSLFPVAPR